MEAREGRGEGHRLSFFLSSFLSIDRAEGKGYDRGNRAYIIAIQQDRSEESKCNMKTLDNKPKMFELPNVARAWKSSVDGSPMLSLVISGPEDLVDSPLWWQKKGLQQTATGYGSKLTSRFKIVFQRKLRRLYHTCYSNAGSVWFVVKGVKIFVN